MASAEEKKKKAAAAKRAAAKKRAAVMNQLTEAGIQFDPEAPTADLEALIPEEEEVEVEGEEGTEEEGEEPSLEDSVDILKNGTIYIRTFSEKIHGEDFRALAEQLIGKPEYSKRGYSIVESSTVPKVKVVYREKEDFEKPLDQQSPDSPMVDKERSFTDKEKALSFNNAKKGTVVIDRRKKKVSADE